MGKKFFSLIFSLRYTDFESDENEELKIVFMCFDFYGLLNSFYGKKKTDPTLHKLLFQGVYLWILGNNNMAWGKINHLKVILEHPSTKS